MFYTLFTRLKVKKKNPNFKYLHTFYTYLHALKLPVGINDVVIMSNRKRVDDESTTTESR